MAIQFRRGAFADFIKSKMVAGEPAVVQSGDTSTQNGKAFYICYTPGSVDRVLTEQDKTAIDSQISDIEDDLAAAEQAIENVRQSIPAVDATLTTAGAAADAKKTGDEIADLKSDLSEVFNTTIEDYSNRTYLFDDVTADATKTTGKFINNASSNIIRDNAGWNYYALSAQPYDVFKVKGYQSGSVKSFYFLDSNDNILAYYPMETISSLTVVENTAIAPSGTAKIYVNENTSGASSIYKATNLHYGHSASYTVWKSKISSVLSGEDTYLTVSPSDITEKTDYYVSGNIGATASETSSVLWRIMSLDVKTGEKYRVSAWFYSMISGVFFIDANNKIVDIQGIGQTNEMHTIDVTVPATAVKMRINDKKSTGFSVKKIVDPINNDLIIINGHTISELLGDYGSLVGQATGVNQYSAGTDKMKTKINLFGSQNGTVNYYNIEYDGTEFKGASDDVAPIQLDCGYVGANHGYYLVYDATKTAHGLTESDIGKTCEIDGETWVLIKIKSSNVFVVGCLDNSHVYGLKAVDTAPTTFDFGSSITATSIARAQLRPSVKNIDIRVVTNTSEVFEIAESYDIVGLGDGIDYIINNVGNNTNNSVIEKSDPIITIRNLYVFAPNGTCIVKHNYKALNNNIILAFWGGTQSGSFGNSDYFAVPMTSYDALSATGLGTNFYRNTWDDQAEPPIIYCQTDNAPNSMSKMMVQGVIMTGRNALINSMAGLIYTTRKMYPYAVQPNASADANTVYDFITFRMPIHANDISDDFEFVQYCKVDNEYYLFVFSKGAVSGAIQVPVELYGKKVETVMSKNAVCHNLFIANAIDVTAIGESYLLLKLT